jgi:cytochrome c peroxidase
MTTRIFRLAIAIGIATIGSAALASGNARVEPIQPIEPYVSKHPEKVELGKKLFFEPRLSMSGIISCNTCHNLSRGGTDNLATSIGHGWVAGPVNAPTVLNSSLAIAQFWDGRAETLQEQAGGPIEADIEMNMPHTLALDVLNSIPGYRAMFKEVFNSPDITMDMVTAAIAEFEETLVTPNSRFDQWLKGDDNAITAVELEGYKIFKDSGCTACHNGSAAGGTSFQRMGIVRTYESTSPVEGRYSITGKDADRFSFKVPTLRNVEYTYPYFHDGQAKTLEESVDIMGQIQLGRHYDEEEIGKIVAFLKTLTGDMPQITLPILPPSSNDTPRPDPFR